MTKETRKYPWLSLFLWAFLGGLAVLAPIVFFLANSSIRSDRENMTQLLVEKGAALIRSFEAGARTGMMGMGWGGLQIQRLLVETARQPDILYLVVTDENGSVVAHSDPEQIGKMHENSTGVTSLERNEEVRYHQVQMEDGVSAFEVYKRFTPIARRPGSGRMRHRGMMMRGPGFSRNWDEPSSEKGRTAEEDWCSAYWKQAEEQPGLGPAHFIFVGLDMSALESARTEARRHTLAMSAGVLLLGLAAMVSLFLAQGFKLARRSLAKVRAFSGQVVENLPMGLIASDENGRVAAFNETAEAILRKSSI